MLEHLPNEEEYRLTAAHIRRVGETEGIALSRHMACLLSPGHAPHIKPCPFPAIPNPATFKEAFSPRIRPEHIGAGNEHIFLFRRDIQRLSVAI